MTNIRLLSGPVVEIELEGEINIRLAGELKEELGKALDLERDISVSAGLVSALDITAFQLLWSAARQAGMTGRAFRFKAPPPPAIVRGLIEAGLPCTSLLEPQS